MRGGGEDGGRGPTVLDHPLAALKHGGRGGEGKGEEGGRGPAVLDHPLAAVKHG